MTASSVHLAKDTPNLSAILTRAAARTIKATSFKSPTPSLKQASSEYRPSSLPSFLSRLSTFKLSTYANKPSTIDAVAASKCGWTNDGKDRLVCGLCNASWVVAGKDGMARDAANALIKKQQVALIENHKSGCPWRTRQCDDNIYRIPLKSPSAMASDIQKAATDLTALVQDVQIKHPASSAQIKALMEILSALPPQNILASDTSNPSSPPSPDILASPTQPPEVSSVACNVATPPSENAVLVALFGWTTAPPVSVTANRPRPRLSSLSTPSISRTGSSIPSASVPASPSLSRAPSVSSLRSITPTSATTRRPRPLSRASSVVGRDASLLHCSLCQRRIGLWTFAPQPVVQHEAQGSREENPFDAGSISAPIKSTPKQTQTKQFDLLREHRAHCPYVVRSTVVPSLPIPTTSNPFSMTPVSNGSSAEQSSSASNDGLTEGWLAVLTVVLRHGMGLRQRARLPRSVSSSLIAQNAISNNDGEENVAELDRVEAMVAGVKSHGGKDLLRYVRGLLG